MTKPTVCIVSLYAWPLFEPGSGGAFGGSEVRMAAIARGLAARNALEVRLVVWDHGQGARVERDGIELFAWPDAAPPPVSTAPSVPRRPRFKLSHWARERYERGGLSRAIAFVPFHAFGVYSGAVHGWHWARRRMRAAVMIRDYPVDRSRFELLDRIGADVMVVHGANCITAEIASWCRARGRPLVFLSGSDYDFDESFKRYPQKRTIYGDAGYLIAYGIENATAHVVQTPAQAEALRAVYGREATVVRNPIDLARKFPRNEDEGTVLWVGKSDAVKRPELALELARRIPSLKLHLVMNPSNAELHQRVEGEAARLPNVRIERAVPFDEIESRFARASVFLSTSAFEGFPNTFLQAAKYGVPIASLAVDPGGMLGTHGAGTVADGDLDRLARSLEGLLGDPARRRETGERALAYAREHHDAQKALAAIEGIVLGAAGVSGTARAAAG